MSYTLELPNHTEDEGKLLATFIQAMLSERIRADLKHGATSMEQAPPLDPWRGLILGEEALECGKALNDNRHGAIHLYAGDERTSAGPQIDELDKELIQTATMAFTWWANRRGDRLPRPVGSPRDLTDLVLHELSIVAEPLHPSWVMQPSTPVDKPVDDTEIHRAVDLTGLVTGYKHWSTNLQEDTHGQAADTAQAPGSTGAGGEQQGPEQEVRGAARREAPDAEPAPRAPEPEDVAHRGWFGWRFGRWS